MHSTPTGVEPDNVLEGEVLLEALVRLVDVLAEDLLEGGDVSTVDVKKSILNHVIFEDAHAERVAALVSKDPVLADINKAAKPMLDADFAALRKLRDDSSPRGVFKKWLSFDSEDPGTWRTAKNIHGEEHPVKVKNGRVIKIVMWCKITTLPDVFGKFDALEQLDLGGCLELTALPTTIGDLSSLRKLGLNTCRSLVALPESIGRLDALDMLDLENCSEMTFPPMKLHTSYKEYHTTLAMIQRITRLLRNTTRFLDEGLSAADADDDIPMPKPANRARCGRKCGT
mgnify:CR=1 FL=1